MTTTISESTRTPTQWWHPGENGKVVCTLCPRECSIPQGRRGFCFVRANVDGQLELTTYGRSSGFCIDPIEKKPLNHFLPGTPVLSLGTAGCNLGCKFCQNWDISKSREMDTLQSYAGPEDIVAAAKRTGCRSIAFTYNDPTIWAEYAIDIAKLARQEDLKTVAVTAGYINPEARDEFYQHIDAANVDLKAFTETFYRKLTQTQLAPVLDTLKYLKHQTNVWFELTTLVIPGENDSPEELREMSDWVVDNLGPDVPMHFSAFHPDFKMRDKPRTPHEKLIEARQIALDAGVNYAYVGNVYDLQRESTYCPSCGKVVIERDWYELGAYHLKGNSCGHCGHEVAGVFDDQPGHWGRKRQPVQIHGQQPQTVQLNVALGKNAPATGQNDKAEATASQSPAKAHATGDAGSPSRGKRTMTEATRELIMKAQDAPKIDFTEQQCEQILAYTRVIVRDAVTGEGADETLPDDIANAPAFGLFVTLKRNGQLRACRGQWGNERMPNLGAALNHVARDTATNDVRFPTITAGELDLLELEVSLMHDPTEVTGSAEDKLAAVEVGKTGLVLMHPQGRGLLLPQVATGNNYNAEEFLISLSQKAGLPNDAWQHPEAALITFEARVLDSPAPGSEFDPTKLSREALDELVSAANKAVHGVALDESNEPLLAEKFPGVLGLYMFGQSGKSGMALGSGHSLLDLVRIAAPSLRELLKNHHEPTEPVNRVVLLWQPQFLKAADYPHRFNTLAQHAVFAKGPRHHNVTLPGSVMHPAQRVTEAMRSAQMTMDAWRDQPDQNKVFAFRVLEHKAPEMPAEKIRPAARAGQFYPGDATHVNRQVDALLDAGRQKERGVPRAHRAIMLPHAGWRFCGRIIAQTLAHTLIPDRVIIIGPKHTGMGQNLSIPPHDAWQLPTGNVPIDRPMANRLLELCPAVACESDAHRMEHGSEVLLPFLQRLNPDVRVLPIVLGRASFEETAPLAQALHTLVEESRDPVLLIISSDMNHFASEADSHRLDQMALDAMTSGDPRSLYDTCTRNQISMCGMLPAVTVMQALQQITPDLDLNLVDYTTSAEASGDPSSVVGYAGMLLD